MNLPEHSTKKKVTSYKPRCVSVYKNRVELVFKKAGLVWIKLEVISIELQYDSTSQSAPKKVKQVPADHNFDIDLRKFVSYSFLFSLMKSTF